MPFVRHPEIEYPQEENWLFEAITESYLPLIQVFQGLVRDGTDFKITLSLTPCLVSMLTDPLLQSRYVRYLDDRIRLADKEKARLASQPEFLRLAHQECEKFARRRDAFVQDWRQDLMGAFKSLLDSGKVEIITSGATHAYLPVWGVYPHIVDLQIQIGIQQYQHYFGKPPLGFWLPECGFYPACGFSPGVDDLLGRAGIKYFFLETHGITAGHPRPKFDVYAPVHCPSGTAAFGRDWFCHSLIWCKEKGYPGDGAYLNVDRDIGRELNPDYLFPFTHQPGRAPTGIKYFRNDGGVYNPELALARCDEHANRFVQQCQAQVERLYAGMGKKPVLVALIDTEHFGHWWSEGPTWLDWVIRKLVYDQKTVKLITAVDYLKMYPTNQVVAPATSSWGYQGYSETWLMGGNQWIYQELFGAVELLKQFGHLDSQPPELKAALDQYLREMLLAQSSDWGFIIHKQTTQRYAERRASSHIENIRTIYRQLNQGRVDLGWLNSIQNKDNIFPDMDLFKVYQTSLQAEGV